MAKQGLTKVTDIDATVDKVDYDSESEGYTPEDASDIVDSAVVGVAVVG